MLQETVLKGIVDPEGQPFLKSVRSNQNKQSYHGSMFSMIFFFNHIKNDQLTDQIKKRILLMFLAMYQQISKTMYIRCELSFCEFFELFAELSSLNAIKQLLVLMDVKLCEQFLINYYTEGVSNLAARAVLQGISQTTLQELSHNNLPGPFVSASDIAMLKGFHSLYFLTMYQRLIELYDLNISAWQPDDGFDGLINTIEQDGALVMAGVNIGLPAHTEMPSILIKNDKPVVLGSRQILFWQQASHNPQSSEDQYSTGHAIVVIGAKSITRDDSCQQYVLFLDPNDPSIPGQQRTVYQLSYNDFIDRLTAPNKPKFTDGYFPKDAMYAVSARRP